MFRTEHKDGVSFSNIRAEQGLLENRYHKYLDRTCFLKAEGMMAYLEYVELNDAKDSARKAQRTANWAIGIAIVIGFLEVTFGLFGLLVDCFSSFHLN